MTNFLKLCLKNVFISKAHLLNLLVFFKYCGSLSGRRLKHFRSTFLIFAFSFIGILNNEPVFYQLVSLDVFALERIDYN